MTGLRPLRAALEEDSACVILVLRRGGLRWMRLWSEVGDAKVDASGEDSNSAG